MAENKTIVQAQRLRKVYVDFWGRPKALGVDGIDFAVYQGDILGMLGPNGSGKSTTIKMILGLLKPTSGVLKVFNHDPREVPIKTRIGYLPEETNLYHHLTAEETLDFLGSLFNLTSKERKRRTNQLLEMVGLTHAAKRRIGEFSKGMARRIGIAQALINDPDLIILDEPTIGLDPLGCEDMKNMIKLLAKRKKTIIICSHLLSDIEDVSNHVLIVYGGKVAASGSLNELLQNQGKVQITTSSINALTKEKIMNILTHENPKSPISVKTPLISLEEFFLDVVQTAKISRMHTDGARSEGKIAGYLSQGIDLESGEKFSEEYLKDWARIKNK